MKRAGTWCRKNTSITLDELQDEEAAGREGREITEMRGRVGAGDEEEQGSRSGNGSQKSGCSPILAMFGEGRVTVDRCGTVLAKDLRVVQGRQEVTVRFFSS